MPEPTRFRPREMFSSERLTMFSDGVFAIAITLLVLELRLPDLPVDAPGTEFVQALIDTLPKFISYCISFAVIGAFWMGHTRMYRKIIRVNHRLAALNLFFLFCVALTPFPTAVLGRYLPQQPLALVLYATTMAATGFMATGLWAYALRHPELVDSRTTPRQIVRFMLGGLVTPTIFLASIGIAFFSVQAALFSWWLIPFTRIAVNRLVRE